MFIYNFKLNKTNIFKIFLIVVIIIIIIFAGITAYRIFTEGIKTASVHGIAEITANNYTNILKAVHDDLDTYSGQAIKFSGYIYRAADFKNDEFVLARDMLINDNKQSLIVGFLCNCKNSSEFPDRTWVEITGTITKGNYHGEIPVIKVTKINEIPKPENEFVLPPDNFYIPTSALYYDED